MKSEVILMKNATYGRMRIGRCITVAEIEHLRSNYIGCSENLLPFFDRKCSAKTDCEISRIDISAENVNPCPPGLNAYLEVSYNCISSKLIYYIFTFKTILFLLHSDFSASINWKVIMLN